MQRDAQTLQDILMAARRISAFVGTSDERSFRSDVLRQSAVERQIMIIGEAVKRLSMELRAANPHIE